ncbi:hypothetical protein [Proteus sp. TJ1640]|uniref:hypothetical protein n=1 Tax=Proteus sp. TJ1640 TaxID=2050968 RepID=UPI000D685B3D|nr:hypothetical protein [Proteus sp. TJ1640]
MSNDICGYIEPPLNKKASDNLKRYIESQNIGITNISKDELYNFPDEFLPSKDSYIFLISDRTDYPNATYLIDYLDYAPEAEIGFPCGAKERLNILLDVLNDIFIVTNIQKMVIALTECNQIEKVKRIKLSEMRKIIHADFEEYQAPPDTLYEIMV